MFRSFLKQSTAIGALALILAILSPSLCTASSWSGGSGNWSSNGDPGWNGTGVPDAAGATAAFSSDSNSGFTTTFDQSATVGTLSLAGTFNGNRTFVLGANVLTFNQDGAGSGSATFSNIGSGSARISIGSGSIVMADDLFINNTNANVSSTQSILSSSTFSGTGNLTVSNVSNSDVNGNIALTASNTFIGNVLIQKGMLTISNNTSLGNASNAVTLGSTGNSASLYSVGSSTNFGNNITVVATTGTNRLGSNSTHASNSSEFSGTILLNGDVRLLSEKTGTAIVEFSNTISGAGSIATEGAGAMHFSGINTYTGDTSLEGTGSLTLDDNAGLTFVIGASGVNNGISGTANQTLTLDGDFTFDLSGAAAVGSWNIVDVASLNETFGSNFQVNGFTESANVWTFGNYSFSEATGVLTAVPEPSTWALIAAAGTIFVTLRRRKIA